MVTFKIQPANAIAGATQDVEIHTTMNVMIAMTPHPAIDTVHATGMTTDITLDATAEVETIMTTAIEMMTGVSGARDPRVGPGALVGAVVDGLGLGVYSPQTDLKPRLLTL